MKIYTGISVSKKTLIYSNTKCHPQECKYVQIQKNKDRWHRGNKKMITTKTKKQAKKHPKQTMQKAIMYMYSSNSPHLKKLFTEKKNLNSLLA